MRWVGGLEVLSGSGDSIWDAVPSVFLTVVSGLATAQIVLWVFDLPGRGFGQRSRDVVASFCLGGVLMGESLGWLWVLDGTLGAGTFAGVIAQGPLMALAAFAYALIPGIVGAAFGLVVGLVEGVVLAFPLAKILGSYEARTASVGKETAPQR